MELTRLPSHAFLISAAFNAGSYKKCMARHETVLLRVMPIVCLYVKSVFFMCYTYIVPIMELPIGVKVKTISLLSSWTVLGCVSIYSPYTEDATADEYQK